MEVNVELVGLLLTVVGQALFVAYKLGKMEQKLEGLTEKLGLLEEKQDKHNNLIERMTRVEDSTKSAHHRLDNISRGVYE